MPSINICRKSSIPRRSQVSFSMPRESPTKRWNRKGHMHTKTERQSHPYFSMSGVKKSEVIGDTFQDRIQRSFILDNWIELTYNKSILENDLVRKVEEDLEEHIRNYLSSPSGERLLNDIIDEKVGEIKKRDCIDMSRNISDAIAEQEIILILNRLKKAGAESINTLEIIMELNIPGTQVERILDRLLSG